MEIIFGINAVKSIIENKKNIIKQVFIIDNYIKHSKLIKIFNNIKNNICIKKVKKSWFHKNLKNKLHQYIAAEIICNNIHNEFFLIEQIKKNDNKFILILDSITDPQNFGACLRNAEAAGIDLVIIPKHKSVKLNSTVRKVASGAADIIPIVIVKNLFRILKILKIYNIFIIGTSHKSKINLFNTDIKKYSSIAFVFGSESVGIRPLIKKTCDLIIKIPMFGKISSLNISVSTGIFLFEYLRQKTINNK